VEYEKRADGRCDVGGCEEFGRGVWERRVRMRVSEMESVRGGEWRGFMRVL
jgi:hypothetical protein